MIANKVVQKSFRQMLTQTTLPSQEKLIKRQMYPEFYKAMNFVARSYSQYRKSVR